MRLSPDTLEARDCPAAPEPGGVLRFAGGREVAVFGPTYTGGVNAATDPATGDVYYGPAPGGGPVLGHRNAAGDPVANDEYEGDPASREGLIPVLVGSPPPPVSYGPEGGYPVFLDGASDAVTAATAAYFAGVDNVRVTNGRPDLPVGDYATLIFGKIPQSLDDGHGILGVAYVGGVTAPHNAFQGVTAYVGPPAGDEVAAHEAGHLFGLVHVSDPTDLMSPTLLPGPHSYSAVELQTIHDAAAQAMAAEGRS